MKNEEKKILGKDIIKLMITTCRPYFSSDEDLQETLDKLLKPNGEYTREEIKEVVTRLTTDEKGKRKPVLRRNKTANEISQDWPSREREYRD